MNIMIEFIKHYRINNHSLNQAIDELKIAYMLAEYLNPDPMSKFEPNKEIKNLLISPNINDQLKGVDKIIDTYCTNEYVNPTKIKEVLNYLIPIYLENRATDKDRKRRELLTELQKLDEESSS